MAALHARCFTLPRPWSAAEIAEISGLPGSFLMLRPHGFLIGRTVLDEAELLTLAVDPDHRRQGIGRALLDHFAGQARSSGARSGYLEVASDNRAAQALYAAAGWRQSGLRRSYYGPGIDALILTTSL